jgi:hypothetical protein
VPRSARPGPSPFRPVGGDPCDRRSMSAIRVSVVRVLLVLAALAVLASPAHAAPPAAIQLDRAAPLPAGVQARGKEVEQVWRWSEGTGTALAVFSSTDRKRRAGGLVSRKIFVQLYRGDGPGLREVRLIQDGEDGCDFDVIVGFLPGSVSVTDADGDGAPELTFAYDTTCTSDVSPATRKLLVLEGADKHALRGQNRVDTGGGQLEGGGFEVAGFKDAAALRRFAEKRWKQLLTEAVPPS